jgi:hypothetical protein
MQEISCRTLVNRVAVRKVGGALLIRLKRAPCIRQGVLAGSNCDDDLADLPARFEITVRIDNLVEWKDSVDDWFQRVLL